MFDLAAVQSAIHEFGFDGWLLYDFRGLNVLAKRVLDLHPGSRRVFYFIPARGEPRKLVHRIEPGALDHLPGSKQVYLKWQELEAGVQSLLDGSNKVALEYSPRCAIPYVSRVDGGVLDLVRACQVEPASSGDLVQLFEATWDDEQWAMHLEAAKHTASAFDVAWRHIANQLRAGNEVRETDVQQVIMDHFKANDLTTYSPPIVGVGPHSGDPHYEPKRGEDSAMKEGDFVLIDLWAKLNRPRAVYSDLTHVGFLGKTVPEKYERIFQIVASARDAAIDFVKKAFAEKRPLQGWQVDQACRDVIAKAGYEASFIHRTGHSIGEEVHGNGANIDNLETREERRILPRTCFSIEPGIYLPEFGVRSEVDVYIDAHSQVHVTGTPPQKNVLPVLASY
jgi:Xaa-Pro aminopeptidase